MTTSFWSPTYSGSRFQDHTIPLDLLEDLSVLQSLLIDIAKEIYYEENNKERVPNGFAEGVSLNLSEIGEGSTISNIVLSFAAVGTMAISSKQSYFEKARDRVIEYVDIINKSQTLTSSVPQHHLYAFHRLGKNLYDDEILDLSPGSLIKNGKLDQKARTKVDSRLKNHSQEVLEIIGSIPNIDKGKANFILEKNGVRVQCSYDSVIFPHILEAFNGYTEGTRVKLKGYGIFNHEFRLIGLRSIYEANAIAAPNIDSRLESLKKLDDNWLNGEGKAIPQEFIEWAKKSISDAIDFDVIPPPRIFPTPTGGIQLEWVSKNYDASLTIESENKIGNFHLVGLKDKTELETQLDLNHADKWKIVIDYIQEYFDY